MTLNIHIDSIYACHIAYIAWLLKIDFNIISPISNKTFNFSTTDYNAYYQRMIDKIYQEYTLLFEPALFEYYIKNTFTFYESNPISGTDITISNNTSIKAAEYDFYTQLHNIGILPNIYQYEFVGNFAPYIASITEIIQQIFNRPAIQSEIDHYFTYNGSGIYNFNDSRFTNMFTWLNVLYFSSEGQTNNLHIPLISNFKSSKFLLTLKYPIIAVIFSGYVRDFIDHYSSHKIIVNNPYLDIYIHTWNNRGPRYEYVDELADITTLTNLYNPISILVEDVKPMKQTFTLLGKITPIFLIWGGEMGDDATHYINAKLYSTWKAFTLMESYETTNNVRYDGIIKINFNIDLSIFNFKGIISDIMPNLFNEPKNALYVPYKLYDKDINSFVQAYTGGGCWKCDVEAKYIHYNYTPKHPYHFNDITQSWFWANRTIGQKACELYLSALQIMQSNHITNLSNYPTVNYKQYREFIYIQEPVDYQGKVYSIDDINKRVVCFYPERLMREYMSNNACVSSSNINGTFRDFDRSTFKI
jgi:hypothetical protein